MSLALDETKSAVSSSGHRKGFIALWMHRVFYALRNNIGSETGRELKLISQPRNRFGIT
jgi:hypothetical protein